MPSALFGQNAGANAPAPARKIFLITFAATLALKLWLAAAFPMTGDEAFFLQWGLYPDWGYYDHPPMIGWFLYALSHLSLTPLVLRSATVALWSLIALGLVDLRLRQSPENAASAYWLGSLFLVQPFAWALNIVSTDTPLILFVFASGYCFLRARLSDRWSWYAASGLFLGLALLSKFFAALLAIAYAVYLVRRPGDRLKLLLIALCALPFFAVNMAYNATHCWSNVMFNVYNRNEGTHWSPGNVLLYLGMMIYLLTPWVSFKLLRSRGQLKRHGAIAVLFMVAFSLMLIVSTRKVVGLHWVLGFVPFAFLFAGVVCEAGELRKYFRWTLGFSAPHLVAIAVVILAPLSFWQGHNFHDDVVFHKKTGEIVARLRDGLPQGGAIMARAYTPASILSYHAGEYWPVFGEGRYHARQDDVIVDFRAYAGRPVRIFDRKPIEAAPLAPYFDRVTVRTFTVEGVTYWFADGENFNYPAYRDGVLRRIAERYYRIPSYLPVLACPFLTRYDFPCPSPGERRAQ